MDDDMKTHLSYVWHGSVDQIREEGVCYNVFLGVCDYIIMPFSCFTNNNICLIPPVMHTRPQHHCATRKFEAPAFLETQHKAVLGHKSCVAAGMGNRRWSGCLMGALCFVLFTGSGMIK